VTAFFQLLGDIYDREKFGAMNIFNMDETSLSTVQESHNKVLALKGKHQVGALTSRERGQSATCVMCVSASGFYVPPMIIFRRARMNECLKNGAPPGTVFQCQNKGWMTSEIFGAWLEHFIHTVKPTKENKVLLILDGHLSHTKNLTAIIRARKSGVVMVSLPPHTTHKLQPLDVAFFGPFSKYYDSAITSYMRTNPGKVVTEYQMSSLLNEAYGRAASLQNAVSGFQKTGLWPLSMSVFVDADFLPARVTDLEVVEESAAPFTAPSSSTVASLSTSAASPTSAAPFTSSAPSELGLHRPIAILDSEPTEAVNATGSNSDDHTYAVISTDIPFSSEEVVQPCSVAKAETYPMLGLFHGHITTTSCKKVCWTSRKKIVESRRTHFYTIQK